MDTVLFVPAAAVAPKSDPRVFPNEVAESVDWGAMARRYWFALLILVLIGGCYLDGQFFGGDSKLSELRRKAEAGDAEAQFNLGTCYSQGQGVPMDSAEAVKWYRKAADQGDVRAQRTIAACYVTGDGVPENLVEAYRWANLAAAQGDESARTSSDAIERMLTPEQIADGKRFARDFQPKKARTDIPSLR